MVSKSEAQTVDDALLFSMDRMAVLEIENAELKDKIVKMRIRCNKIHSEQLQEIRKLKAVNMLQKQDSLFND